jgi:endoglucanase
MRANTTPQHLRCASLLALAVAALSGCATQGPPEPFVPAPIEACVNLSSGLQNQEETWWNHTISAADFPRLHAAGFDRARLLVSWDRNADPAPPYTIEAGFLDRVAAVTEEARAAGISVQLNWHDDDRIHQDPIGQRARFVAIWTQIAERFAGAPADLTFELLNEPNGDIWTPEMLNDTYAAALVAVRRSNPTRLVWLNGPDWSSREGLRQWTPPPGPHIGVSVHFYEPWAMTHDGVEGFPAEVPRFTRPWGSLADRAELRAAMAEIAAWGQAHRVPLQIGEFGVVPTRPQGERAAWLAAVAREARSEGLGWCVFDYAAGFPIADGRTGRLQPGMAQALGLRPRPVPR